MRFLVHFSFILIAVFVLASCTETPVESDATMDSYYVASGADATLSKTAKPKKFNADDGVGTTTTTPDGPNFLSVTTGTMKGDKIKNAVLDIAGYQDWVGTGFDGSPLGYGVCVRPTGDVTITAYNGDVLTGTLHPFSSWTCEVSGSSPLEFHSELTIVVDAAGNTGKFANSTAKMYMTGDSVCDESGGPCAGVFNDTFSWIGTITN